MFNKMKSVRQSVAAATIAIMMVLSGCEKSAQSVQGKYSLEQGTKKATYDFRPGGKVIATSTEVAGTRDLAYTIEGDRLTINMGGKNDLVLVIMADGTLKAGVLTLKKE